MGAAGDLLLLYALTDLMACLSPGPAVLTVTSQALCGTRRGTAGAIMGINLGNLVWFTMAGLGLATVLKASPLLFSFLRWGGIAYIIWLSAQVWRQSGGFALKEECKPNGFKSGMLTAIAVQLSNPKALLFFAVMLPPFIDVQAPVLPQIILLAAIAVTIETCVLTGYATLAHRIRKMTEKGDSRSRIWLSRISALLILSAALLLINTGTS